MPLWWIQHLNSNIWNWSLLKHMMECWKTIFWGPFFPLISSGFCCGSPLTAESDKRLLWMTYDGGGELQLITTGVTQKAWRAPRSISIEIILKRDAETWHCEMMSWLFIPLGWWRSSSSNECWARVENRDIMGPTMVLVMMMYWYWCHSNAIAACMLPKWACCD